jgi:hypothetical protein
VETIEKRRNEQFFDQEWKRLSDFMNRLSNLPEYSFVPFVPKEDHLRVDEKSGSGYLKILAKRPGELNELAVLDGVSELSISSNIDERPYILRNASGSWRVFRPKMPARFGPGLSEGLERDGDLWEPVTDIVELAKELAGRIFKARPAESK